MLGWSWGFRVVRGGGGGVGCEYGSGGAADGYTCIYTALMMMK